MGLFGTGFLDTVEAGVKAYAKHAGSKRQRAEHARRKAVVEANYQDAKRRVREGEQAREQARLKAEAEHRREQAEAAALRAERIAMWNDSITTMRDVRRAAWRAIDDLA